MNTLPEGFDFYHLGKVVHRDHPEGVRAKLDPALYLDSVGALFTLQGDLKASILMIFDEGLERSTYLEICNTIASRWADGLATTRGLDLLISPPIVLEGEQLGKALTHTPPAERREYLHLDRGYSVKLEAFVYV